MRVRLVIGILCWTWAAVAHSTQICPLSTEDKAVKGTRGTWSVNLASARSRGLLALDESLLNAAKSEIQARAQSLLGQTKSRDRRLALRYVLALHGDSKQWDKLIDTPCYGTEARWALGQRAFAARRWKRAARHLGNLPTWHPNWAAAQLLLAEAKIRRRKGKSALNSLRKLSVTALNKSSAVKFWQLVSSAAQLSNNKALRRYALRRLWRPGQSKTAINRHLRRLKDKITVSDEAELRLQAMTTSMSSKKKLMKWARKRARKVRGLRAYLKGAALSRSPNTRKDALNWLERAVRLLKNKRMRARAHYQLGHTLGRLGKEPEGLKHLQRAIELAPNTRNHERTLWRLMRMYRYLGQGDELLTSFQQLVKRFPWSKLRVRATWAAAWHFFSTGNYARARTLFTEFDERYGAEYADAHQPRASQARYWAARANQKLGNDPSAELEAVAHQWPMGHYGHLARTRLGANYVSSPRQTNADNAIVDAHHSIALPVALVRMGLTSRAEARLRKQLNGTTPAGGGDLLWQLAQRHDHPKSARFLACYRTAHMAPPSTHSMARWQAAMITPFYKEFSEAASLAGLPRSILYAIGYHESRFRPHVRSVADAYGILQVIAGVERLVTEAMGWPRRGKRGLLKTDYNAKISALFLAALLRYGGNNSLLMTVAYGSGNPVLRKWHQRITSRQFDVFVESMPFSTTRSYAKGVGVLSTAYAMSHPDWREGHVAQLAYRIDVPAKLGAFTIATPQMLAQEPQSPPPQRK